MQNCYRWKSYTIWLIIVVIALCSGSCHEKRTSPTDPVVDKQVDRQGLPADPEPGDVVGKIIGTITKQPLVGVTVTIKSRSVKTNMDGMFRFDDVGEGNLVVVISGDQVYTRTVMVDTNDGRSVELDAIEQDGGFHLGFYRELARGNHPEEGELLPIHRWTNPVPPTFYIDTNASATYDGIVTQAAIETTRHVITQILPIFTGQTYLTAPIQVRQFSQHNFEVLPDNSVVISFDDTLYLKGALGITFTDPDFTSTTTRSINKAWIFVLNQEELYTAGRISREEIVAHEFGHACGYRHTSLLPSVMVKARSYGGLFSEYDRIHMAIMYHRPAGNTDIDNDPVVTGKMTGPFPERQVFIDRRANFLQPADVIQRLRSLRSLTAELFQ